MARRYPKSPLDTAAAYRLDEERLEPDWDGLYDLKPQEGSLDSLVAQEYRLNPTVHAIGPLWPKTSLSSGS